MIRIKICGVTRKADAQLAVSLGASAIGMILSPSLRCISVARARAICLCLPPFVDRVGVFVDAPASEVRAKCAAACLTRVQLHGHATPAAFAKLPVGITRALSYDQPNLAREIRAWRSLRADVHFVVDLPKNRPHDQHDLEKLWTVAAAIARREPLILAGGLNASNVRHAIATVQPAAIDVARGVESAPGRKDPGKLAAFFREVGNS